MPGGSISAWPELKPIFQAIAAKVGPNNDIPCCDWVGSDGAGHYVKMVHNGIEYGDMQLICEAYAMMKNLLGMTPPEMSEVFARWNKGPLDSYLIEITRDILRKKDPETGKWMVDVILHKAGQKGTGKWTSQNALDLGIPIPVMMEAVVARSLSAMKDERVAASRQLPAPALRTQADKEQFLQAIHDALYASKIMSYAQGFQLLRAAAGEYKWDLNYGSIALLWRGGCIIRARFLEQIKEAFDKQPDLKNLILAPYFTDVIKNSEANWRRAVSEAVLSGIAAPAFTSALSYYDGYRSAQLPANLLQAQRDYFGAHTYERVDKARVPSIPNGWKGKRDPVKPSGAQETDLDAEAQKPLARQLELLMMFVVPLDKAGLDYMVTGSLAARLYGETRSVRNVDVILRLRDGQIPAFRALFPKEEFSCPSAEIIALELARAEKGRVALFHLSRGYEADIYPACDALHRWGLEHRRRTPLSETNSIWTAPPEYLLLRKLLHCLRKNGSPEHFRDAGNLLAHHEGNLDMEFLQSQVQALGVEEFWKKLART